jgi:hypothetical protein
LVRDLEWGSETFGMPGERVRAAEKMELWKGVPGELADGSHSRSLAQGRLGKVLWAKPWRFREAKELPGTKR